MSNDSDGELGNCFMSSAQLLLQLFCLGEGGAIVVHGMPDLSVSPYRKYSHSWVELNGMCLDTEAQIAVPKQQYYSEGNIDPKSCIKYSPRDILDEINTSGHWGPWHETIKETI